PLPVSLLKEVIKNTLLVTLQLSQRMEALLVVLQLMLMVPIALLHLVTGLEKYQLSLIQLILVQFRL
ncbi:MAG: hypothetical protein DSY79_00820, partial [Chloroflexi bacterium]